MATMEDSERGYFNTDHSAGARRPNYENLFAMDPALFNTSPSIPQDPNSHQDLDNILGGSFLDQLGSGSGMNTGFTPGIAWDTQATAYSPYPDISYTHTLPVDHQQSGAGLRVGSMASGLVQSFPEPNGVDMQAVQFPDSRPSVQIDGLETTAVPAMKRKSDAAADATDGTLPKAKKKRGPRKTKQKTEEEKRAKEERKLERNRMAASKCRQKKKVATEQMMENFNELERQNHWMKACLEEAKQDRNKILALLLEHKECNHPAIDKCLEAQLARIADEFENPPQTDTSMFEMDDDPRLFLNSNASSPSNESQNMSQRNSRSDSMAMSRSGSHASYQKPSTGSRPPQSWPTAGYESWKEQFGYQQQPISDPTKSSHIHSPTSYSSRESSMSRQNSSRTSVSEGHGDHQRTDSGISEMDTPPEDRKKNMTDSPADEGISLGTNERVLRSRGPQMMSNQRLASIHPAMAGPSDLQDPSTFLAGVSGGSL